LLSSIKDDTFDTYSIPESRDPMISIEVFGKLVVEPKTLGLGILFGKIFENVFKHLGVVATPLRCLQMVLQTWRWTRETKELVDF
jgi:hypothetical protein